MAPVIHSRQRSQQPSRDPMTKDPVSMMMGPQWLPLLLPLASTTMSPTSSLPMTTMTVPIRWCQCASSIFFFYLSIYQLLFPYLGTARWLSPPQCRPKWKRGTQHPQTRGCQYVSSRRHAIFLPLPLVYCNHLFFAIHKLMIIVLSITGVM